MIVNRFFNWLLVPQAVQKCKWEVAQLVTQDCSKRYSAPPPLRDNIIVPEMMEKHGQIENSNLPPWQTCSKANFWMIEARGGRVNIFRIFRTIIQITKLSRINGQRWNIFFVNDVYKKKKKINKRAKSESEVTRSSNWKWCLINKRKAGRKFCRTEYRGRRIFLLG